MTLPYTSMHDKICLVTGATAGLGKATAEHLACAGAHVVVVGRNPQRIQHAIEDIRAKSGNKRISGLCGDLSIHAEVRQVASQFLDRFDRLDILVNNVGATLLQYQPTRDGLEMTWALNYLYHFYLTNLLLERLKTTAARFGEARILEITSSMFRFASSDFTKRQEARNYNGVIAYAQSKRAMMVFTCELARRLNGSGVTINGITPGFVATGVATRDATWARWMMFVIRRFSATPEKGAEPVAHLATAPDRCGTNGSYFQRYAHRSLPPSISGEQAGQALWDLSESLLASL